jgi:hypothetical protein
MREPFRYRLVIVLLIFDFVLLNGQSDDPFIGGLRDKLASYSRSGLSEDIYLHSDRDTYIAGEYLWLSTCLINRQSMAISAESSYAYIELIDPGSQPVSQTRIRLENGSGFGGLTLPDSLAAGEYIIRAYTNRMKNFLPDGCFMKRITIYNPFSEAIFKRLNLISVPDAKDRNVLFFPEGGRLLSGFVNKVGVRVFGKDNCNPGFRGYLSDGINDSLVAVGIDSTGIGSFEFFAKKGTEYKLISDDKKYTLPLPEISQNGYSVYLEHMPGNTLKLKVNSNNATSSGVGLFYVTIISEGNLIYSQRVNPTENITELIIAENTLNQGINQITVFDEKGVPSCNRLVYKPVVRNENIRLGAPGESGKREKVTLEILPASSFSQTELSDLSLSVSAIVSNERSKDIYDYLVTGNEYVSGRGDITDRIRFSEMSTKAIDDYLLSLRSNRIKWEDILTGRLPDLRYSAEKGRQFLSGYYTSRSKTEVNAGKLLFLSRPGKIPFFRYAETDRENRFEFSIRDKESSDDFIIQPALPDNNFSIEIESPYSQNYPHLSYFNDSSQNKIPGKVINMSVNYQVAKIYGISSRGDTVRPVSSLTGLTRFYGKPDQELVMSDYISLPVMQEVFFELVPGVQVRKKKSEYVFSIQDAVTKYYYDTPPVLLVDGVIIDDPSLILNLDPELVEQIDVIKSGYLVGDVTFSGIISVITKAGDFSNINMPEKAVRIRKSAFDLPRRFKSPDYTTDLSRVERLPDFRNTLYWNPDLKPGKDGRILVDIMTSDFGAEYEINVQGILGGKAVSVGKRIVVK